MSKPLAIQACFTHWVPVKGRSVLQLQFEIPIESQAEILTYLGAPGNPGESKWVAIALLNTGPVKAEMKGGLQAPALPQQGQAAGPKSEGDRAVQKAGMLANDVRFQVWASDYIAKMGDMPVPSAKEFIRKRCGVVSRKEFATDPLARQRFWGLVDSYEQEMGLRPEVRG